MLLLAIVGFALLSGVSGNSGLLTVRAQSSGAAPIQLQGVTASVNGYTGTTPFNISLSQGQYIVTFGPANWFHEPSPKSVSISKGLTQYAVGVYIPIVRAISITGSGFNQTKVSGYHGVTPFIWINTQGSPQQLVIQNVVRLTLSPGQNYTHVFDSPGTYYYSVPTSPFNGTATVG